VVRGPPGAYRQLGSDAGARQPSHHTNIAALPQTFQAPAAVNSSMQGAGPVPDPRPMRNTMRLESAAIKGRRIIAVFLALRGS
jgi:hypothetical protein